MRSWSDQLPSPGAAYAVVQRHGRFLAWAGIGLVALGAGGCAGAWYVGGMWLAVPGSILIVAGAGAIWSAWGAEMCWVALLFAVALLPPRWMLPPYEVRQGVPTPYILLSLILLAWAALLVRRLTSGDLSFRTSGLEIYQLALFCLALLGLIVRQRDYFHVSPALAAIVLLFGPMLAFHLPTNSKLGYRQVLLLCKVLAGFGAFLSFVSLRYPLHFIPGLEVMGEFAWGQLGEAMVRAYGVLGGPSLTGSAVASLVPICAVLAMSSRGASRFLYVLFAFLCTVTTVLSVQRAVIFALIVSMLLLAWLARDLVWRNRRLAAALATLVGLTIFFIVSALRSHVHFDRLTSREITRRGDQIRMMSMQAAIQAGLQRPLLGGGIGRYFPSGTARRVVAVEEGRALRGPHSLPLLGFSEMGAFGMLFMLVLMFKPPIDLLRFYWRARDEATRWLLAAFACSALGLGLCSIFSWALASMPRYALFVWLFLGLAYRAAHVTSPAPKAVRPRHIGALQASQRVGSLSGAWRFC